MKLPGTALRAYFRDARDAFTHAPVEVLMGVALAAAFSVSIRHREPEWWTRVFAAGVIALPLVFGASVLRARGLLSARARWGAAAGALACAGAYSAWIFSPGLESEGWRAAALAGAAWLALALAAFPGGVGGRRRRFWRFNALLLGRILAVGLYGAALFAALAGAVAAVTSLFELRTPEHLYSDLAGAVFFALVPWVVAGGVPVLAAEGEGHTPLTAVRRAGRYLYAVVLVVYLAILFAYTLKVAATGDLPQNILSPIVLFAGLAGLLGGIFLEPLQDDSESRGVARLVRLFPALLLPLLPLPIWAVGVRQDQYGWTEFRYLRLLVLVALAVLAVWGTVRLVRRRAPLLAPVPAVLAAALVLGSVGPWSAQAVSRRDQSARLRAALAEAGLFRGGRVTRPLREPGRLPADTAVVTDEEYGRLDAAARYLLEAHGAASVERVIGARLPGGEPRIPLVIALGLRTGCRPVVRKPSAARALLAVDVPVQVAAGTLHRFYANRQAERPRSGVSPRGPEVVVVGSALQVRGGGGGEAWVARVELGPLVSRVFETPRAECERTTYGSLDIAPGDAIIPLLDAAGRHRGEVVVTEVVYDSDFPDDTNVRPRRINVVQGMLLVRG